MANGFILLPIILSVIGPTPDHKAKHVEREARFERRRSTLKPHEIAAHLAAHAAKGGKLESDGNNKTADIEMRHATDNSQMPMQTP